MSADLTGHRTPPAGCLPPANDDVLPMVHPEVDDAFARDFEAWVSVNTGAPNLDRLIARPLAGRTLDPGGERGWVLADWSDDGSQPGIPIAPPHVHLEEDEAWFVLEGRLGFRLGDAEVLVDTGTAVFGPRGLAHTYWNPGPGAARYLLVMGPRTSALLDALHDGTPRDGEAMRELFESHGMRLL